MNSTEIKRLHSKLTIEVLWIYLLSLLNKEPSHAYLLRKKIKEEFDFLPGNVTAYIVLYKLEKRGFVEGKRKENKKIYSITSKGRELLKLAKKELIEKEKKL